MSAAEMIVRALVEKQAEQIWRNYVNTRVDKAEREAEHRAMFARLMNMPVKLEQAQLDGADDQMLAGEQK